MALPRRTALALSAVAGCFSPDYPVGLPCSESLACPPEQVCQAGLCLAGQAPNDGGAPADGGTSPDDDGQAMSPDSAGASSRIVFVTSASYSGDLGGLGGADDRCQQHADDAGLPGTFMAWLSTADTSPADRMNHHDGPYLLPGGNQIAADWQDLTEGSLSRQIDQDEHGQPHEELPFVCTFGEIWTNTDRHGNTRSATDCSGWTSTSGTSEVGNIRLSNHRWTEDDQCASVGCTTALPLYCFEQ